VENIPLSIATHKRSVWVRSRFPATVSTIADAIRWAEEILRQIMVCFAASISILSAHDGVLSAAQSAFVISTFILRRRYRVAENTDTQIIFGIPDEWKSFEQRNLLFFEPFPNLRAR
jgi:hypothetical protein